MSKVLTVRSDLEYQIVSKLEGYTRPVKTKHLADRMGIERADLVATLNKLRIEGKIRYTKQESKLNDHRGRDDLIFGWVLT